MIKVCAYTVIDYSRETIRTYIHTYKHTYIRDAVAFQSLSTIIICKIERNQ